MKFTRYRLNWLIKNIKERNKPEILNNIQLDYDIYDYIIDNKCKSKVKPIKPPRDSPFRIIAIVVFEYQMKNIISLLINLIRI